jgi:hypothetical protein
MNNQQLTILVQNLLKEDVFHNIEEIDASATVEDLKCLLEIESGIPVQDQVLFFRNRELDDHNTIN